MVKLLLCSDSPRANNNKPNGPHRLLLARLYKLSHSKTIHRARGASNCPPAWLHPMPMPAYADPKDHREIRLLLMTITSMTLVMAALMILMPTAADLEWVELATIRLAFGQNWAPQWNQFKFNPQPLKLSACRRGDSRRGDHMLELTWSLRSCDMSPRRA